MPTNTPALSPSFAKLLADPGKGAASVWRQYLAPDRMQQADKWGTLKRGNTIDALVLGTKEVKIGTKATKHDPKTTIVVSPSLYKECSDSATSIEAFLSEADVDLTACEKQEKLRWQTDGHIDCVGKPDFFDPAHDVIVDLKTSHSLSDGAIKDTIEEYGYDIQAAAYLEAYSALGRGRKTFAFLFAEKDAPYLCRWVIPGPETIGKGTAKWRKAAAAWKECIANNRWPGPEPLQLA